LSYNPSVDLFASSSGSLSGGSRPVHPLTARPITIRPAAPEDLPALSRLGALPICIHHESDLERFIATPRGSRTPTRRFSARNARRRASYPRPQPASARPTTVARVGCGATEQLRRNILSPCPHAHVPNRLTPPAGPSSTRHPPTVCCHVSRHRLQPPQPPSCAGIASVTGLAQWGPWPGFRPNRAIKRRRRAECKRLLRVRIPHERRQTPSRTRREGHRPPAQRQIGRPRVHRALARQVKMLPPGHGEDRPCAVSSARGTSGPATQGRGHRPGQSRAERGRLDSAAPARWSGGYVQLCGFLISGSAPVGAPRNGAPGTWWLLCPYLFAP
jgi:hypothetical protein